MFGFGQSKVLYITPLQSTPCLEKPCLTLSSFAANTSWLIELNATLVFLPGNHTLGSDVSVSNISYLSIFPKSSFKGSQNPIIICWRNANFKFDNVEHLLMRNLKFVGCGKNRLYSVSQFLIEGSIFLGINGSGTALEIVDTNASIINCSFIFNKAGSYRGPIGVLEYWKQNIDANISVYSYIGGAVIANKSNIVIARSQFEGNSAKVGGAIFAELGSNITIINSTFVKNDATCNAYDLAEICFGGVLHSESGLISDQTQLTVVDSEFSGNSALYGGVVSTYSGTVNCTSCNFSNNWAGVYSNISQPCIWTLMNITAACFGEMKHNPALWSGGVLFLMNGSTSAIEKSQFYNNTAIKNGGALHVSVQSAVTISNCEFLDNKALGSGGVIYLSDASKVNIGNKSMFHNNIAAYIDGQGGVLAAFIQSSVIICDSEFWSNVGLYAGGVLYLHNVSVSIDNSHFHNNAGKFQGGVLDVFNSFAVTLHKCEFHNNTVIHSGGGVIIVMDSYTLTLSGNLFMHNKAQNNYGGVLLAARTKTVLIDDNDFLGNCAPHGGAIAAFMSDLKFKGWSNELINNAAESGGAIFTSGSTLNVYNRMTISDNIANNSGGGVYLHRSELNCQDSSTIELTNNRAIDKGGGIHGINSLITILFNRSSQMKSLVDFTNNSAAMGGGVYLETTAEIRILKMGEYMNKTNVDINKKTKMINLYFSANSATVGEAAYVDDETNFEICTGQSEEMINCFIQVLSPRRTNNFIYDVVSIEFTQNNVYGGLLDRCTLSPLAEILILDHADVEYITHPIYGVSYAMTISNLNTLNITSAPVQLCFCRQNYRPDCSYQPQPIQVKKGEKFTLSLVAVDQVNHTVPNTTIYSTLSNRESGLSEGQMAQTTKNDCTDLTFNVYSPQFSEELLLYANGPCKNAGRSQSRVTIEFLNCTCPIGFQPKVLDEKNNCECVCDSKLSPFITDPNCNPTNKTVMKNGNFWIAYLNGSDALGHYNYLIYSHCPLDYCHSSDSKVQINLSVANGSDMQCANNRSGLLCGLCQPGLNPSLGSSRCISCSKKKDFVLFLIVLVVAGLALVALLLILNLTVAVGTLNGLVFYANIVGANSNLIFSSSSTRYLSVFISVLNLELGIDYCIEGINTYWKTWLQLAFPTYVIFLVIMIIVFSEYSIKFSRLMAKKNPVATLATLILLSYSRMLNTVITALSFATLDYPDGSHTKVWLADATVEYLSGKHIALFIIALLILTVGIVYSFLLFFWQWILHHHHNMFFKWVRYQKLCHFIEPYHAPYMFRHRYWTGLLLFVRVALYLVFALNVSGDPGVNLLAISVITSCLIFLKGFFGQIYKNLAVEMIEMISYLNIALFSAATLYSVEVEGNHIIVVYISGTIALALFLVVLIYHIFTEVLLYLYKRYNYGRKENNIQLSYQPLDSNQVDPPEPTFSVIDVFLHEEKSKEQCNSDPLLIRNESAGEDRPSVDSTAPLLDEETD